MTSWDTDVVKASLVGNEAVSGIKNNAENIFSSTTKKSIADVESAFSQVSVVGMDVNKIPNMQNAIFDYVREVETALSNLQNHDPRMAFQGQQATALMTYIEEIKAVCNNVCSYMYAFSADLDQVQKAYESKDASLHSTIKSDATTTRSAFSEYGRGGYFEPGSTD